MNRYSLLLCATLALHTAQTCTTHATRIMRATPALLASRPGIHGARNMLARRALHHTAQPPAGPTMPEEPVKTAALLLLKKACSYSCAGSAIFFAGHEWGNRKGYEEGFFSGEIHATADITKQISDQALAWAKKETPSNKLKKD